MNISDNNEHKNQGHHMSGNGLSRRKPFLGVRQKLFAPFVVMIVLELFAGIGIYALTSHATTRAATIYRIGNIQQGVSQLANLAAEEHLNLMLGRRGALLKEEWEEQVGALRTRAGEVEQRLLELGFSHADFSLFLRESRREAGYQAKLAQAGSDPELMLEHNKTSLDPAMRRLFTSWHAVQRSLEARLAKELDRLTWLGHRFRFLPFFSDIVDGGVRLGQTIRHVRRYDEVKELALWAEIRYIDFLDGQMGGDLATARRDFRSLRSRLKRINRELKIQEEKQVFQSLQGWTDVFEELLSDEASQTMYPYLPVALYRNGMPLFMSLTRFGQREMELSYQDVDIVGQSVRSLLQLYTGVLIFFAVLAMGIAMILGRVIMDQISLLLRGFGRLETGDFSVRLDVERTDEIGDLQHGFNRTATGLQTREENLMEARGQLEDLAFRLQHYNENLEREVQKRTAELRAANEELLRADRMKSEFMANMSHELRTPLNSIIGFSKVLLNGIDGPVTARQQQDLDLIHQSGRHLLNLINDILDFAKIEAGRLSLYPERLNPVGVAAQAIETAKTLTAAKGLDLVLLEGDRIPDIRADRTRLIQILLNLIGNAVKFTERGTISVRVVAEDRAEGAGVALSVIDTGAGISPGDQENIFRKFQQVDSSSTRKHGGSGLGLSIAKELVELHEGTIGVESVEGVGSTFTIWLPEKGPTETVSG